MDPVDELRRLCYGGETLVETVAVGRGTVGVTSHRVLVLTPNGPGARFHAVDRPNVTDVTVRTNGPTRHRNRAIKAGIVAVPLLVVGTLALPGGLPPDTGIGGLSGSIGSLIAAFGIVAVTLMLLGLLTLLVAVTSLMWYLWQRDPEVVIVVAGDDPVGIPINWGETSAVDRLRDAVTNQDWPMATPTGQ